jgi:hypothetical protein
VADTLAAYEAVRRMKPVPFGKSTLLGIAVPTLIPILVLLSTQVPIKERPSRCGVRLAASGGGRIKQPMPPVDHYRPLVLTPWSPAATPSSQHDPPVAAAALA